MKRSSSGKLKNHFHGGYYYFPPEILINILSRLPLKSLVRFQCVQKSWNSLITHPSFKLSNPNSYHILRSYRRITDPPQIPLHIDRVRLEFQPTSDPNPNEEENLKKSHQFTGHYVFGSSNGLICFGGEENPDTYRGEPFYLWNPGMNRCKKVPSLNPIPMDGCSLVISKKYEGHIQNVVGLGFCGNEGFNDYKLVRVSFHHRPNLGFSSPPGRCSYCRGHLNVYSLNSDSWKNIANVNVPSCLSIHKPKFGTYAFVGGVHYWLINHYDYRLDGDSDSDSDSDEDARTDYYSLVGFDLVNERFLDKEVNLPEEFVPSEVNELYVFELNGALALYEAIDDFSVGCLWVSSSTDPDGARNWSVLQYFEGDNLKDLLVDERLPFALQISLEHDREIYGMDGEFYFEEITSYDGIYVKSLALLGVPGGYTRVPCYDYEYDIPLTDQVIDVLITEKSYQDRLDSLEE